MGAALWLLVVLIVLAAVAWVLWSLFAAGRAASSVADKPAEETAPHSDEHSSSRSVHYTAEDGTDHSSGQPEDEPEAGEVRKPADPSRRPDPADPPND